MSADLAKDLIQSDGVVTTETLPPPVLTNSEKEAIRQFCAQSLELQKFNTELKEEKKKWNESVKEKRKYLQEWVMSQASGKLYTVPRSVYHKAEEDLGKKGLPSVAPYLRLMRNTTDANITPLVAENAVMEVDEDKIKEYANKEEEPKKDKQDKKRRKTDDSGSEVSDEEEDSVLRAIIDAIVDTARNNIRTHRESIALSNSLEKGIKPLDVPEMPNEIAEKMIQMHEAQSRAKLVGTKFKDRCSDINSTIKRLQPKVSDVLDKTGTTSQPVKLQGGVTHKIIKSTSSRASKVTIKVFEDAVSDAIYNMDLRTGSLQQAIKDFKEKKKECIKRIQLKLNSIPMKQTSTVKLVVGKPPSNEDEKQGEKQMEEEEQQEDEEDNEQELQA